MADWRSAFGTVLDIARTSIKRDIQYPAAALAYYGFVSLLPLLVILLAVLGESAASEVQLVTLEYLTPAAQELVLDALTDSRGRVGATLFALGVLLWSGANITAGFQTVVEDVEGEIDRSLAGHLRDGVGVLGSLVFGIVSVLLVSALFVLLPEAPFVLTSGLVALPVALTVSFLPLYYLPSRDIDSLSTAAPGAVTAAVGWTVLLAGIRFYAENAGSYAIFGVLSGIILILTSLYAAAALLMIGHVVNATLSDVIAPLRRNR
ncbi:YihY/virulence factor BrkB family protein [Halomicroarcula limicola]|uniref:YihY/virulence factor BrkB family protein n=1 Tax=Haloarcula limicola TaxID=1429915 RepID=A0A8J7Y4V8_9EURY|nr:YihY/virulence factor BrkB family protein [Halomicroarcula limicola]MBV0924067.1 YihY/virulence factor BrkB family protein [Halomicroarcula limicola]